MAALIANSGEKSIAAEDRDQTAVAGQVQQHVDSITLKKTTELKCCWR